MSWYLVMRRTMTGTWEDCLERPIEADGAEEAQAAVGDGLGIYRVIDVGEPSVVGHVTHVLVEATVSRSTTAAPPPLEQPTAETPAEFAESIRGLSSAGIAPVAGPVQAS